ncbi:hypothetical protein GGD63_008209 [Bradyrhizobium sp. cir1]|nr:hypothetical protein [Bradyrhizobium sp. cir1]MBB4375360.1 hypothetical protein [Bradyrhizobium sp. cir1]
MGAPPGHRTRLATDFIFAPDDIALGQGGVIFSDGIEADRLDFNAGAEVTIGIAARRGRLIV